jgi:hypothetical protein
MPILFIAVGVVLVSSGVFGDPVALWGLVKGDFSGPNNFIFWLVAIVLLGALGHIQGFERLSKLFMVLVVLALLLTPNPKTQQAQGVVIIKAIQDFLQSTTGQKPKDVPQYGS